MTSEKTFGGQRKWSSTSLGTGESGNPGVRAWCAVEGEVDGRVLRGRQEGRIVVKGTNERLGSPGYDSSPGCGSSPGCTTRVSGVR